MITVSDSRNRRVKDRLARLAALVLTGAFVPIGVGINAPAEAACATSYRLVSDTASNSDQFLARSGCDGVYGVQWANAVANKYAKGQFFRDGTWHNSSLGFVFVPSASPGNEKLIGNTVDGRLCRVVAQSGTSSMAIRY